MTQPFPLVGIIMGSDSDLPTMQSAIAVCEEFNIPHEVAIVSAHRTPEKMVEYAKNAHKRGLKVIIAGAGGAAHLPGMVAALTPLPVIGVPVATRHLQGVDSLYSIVQMPRGIPVATVAINNAQNAGLLAVQMLASHNLELLEKVQKYRQNLQEMVENKQAELEQIGYQDYLKKQELKS
ncbi:phosphoribosylaminoimidazole carboxylase, catalytic subunit [Rippkaea orientalis PCC 8801]|uniref:N5-carboxyaminoimidazole ribonucleotide mutase n=1 Tax=Rippkaea orientalis (strain PCC 8801 / RF-1) TaxID=41431 RepID=B7JY41_RIPO1|nr:5-(carboxyamino)imidazole ribonucleotide mutase [Rippkaea orientalis]ACK67143.1 phosphoribosylaminoimidazole carboxylase, catalytic subunit [Rippkaea orientalis PCC 8801]